jgi:predicted metal-dependent peptidase
VAVARANDAGNIPGSLQRLIDELNRPKVNWRDQTRRFIDFSTTKDVSWARLNRRSTALNTLMPGYISDRLHHMVFVDDISGSVSHEMMREMVSEVGGALEEGAADKLTVLYADTEVRHVDEFYPGDVVKAQAIAGGGTDFRDSFRWIAENAQDASCVIYLTDLQVYEFGEDPGCPVLWAVFGPLAHFEDLASKVPFGMCIHVSETY